MGKKKDKKSKKVSAKKEKYAKFKKDKPGTLDLNMPELTPEQQRQKQDDEQRLMRFWRFNRNPPPAEVVERKAKSKR